MLAELIAASDAPSISAHIDQAVQHPWAFVVMAILMLIFGVGRVARETKISVKKWSSFLHLWMAAYLVLLTVLMALTTAMALVLLVDSGGKNRLDFLPDSFVSIAAAVVGVFGFEFLVRKFIIGFGENQLDLSTTMQNLVDQAVAATLKKEAG
jgi:hypothetical protein